MPIFPYDDYDDEGIYADYPPRPRRRSALPDIEPGLGIPMPARGAPGAMPPTFPSGRQSRYDELGEARDVYLKGTPVRGKSAVLGAIRGALQGLMSGQGALPGAVTGAIGGAVDPRGMREQEFNRKIRPQIEERFAYEDQAAAQQRQQGIDAERSALNAAQIGNLQSEGAYRQGRLEIGRQNARRQSEVAQSTIDLNNARAEAARTGKSVIRDVVGEDGQVRTYQIGANGEMTELGGSARAAINQSNIKSREKVAGMREAGVNTRASARAAQPKKPFRGYKSMTDIYKYMSDTGRTESQAIADALNDGYRIAGRR